MRTLSILIGVILVLFGVWTLSADRWKPAEPLTDLSGSWPFASGELRDLQVKSDDELEIRFVNSVDGTSSVTLDGKGTQKMADTVAGAHLSSGKLELDLRDTSNHWFDWFRFGSSGRRQQLVVSLTDDALLDSLKVQSDSGTLSLTEARVKIADLSMDSGSVTISNLTAQHLKLQADSGSIRAEGINADSDIRADSGSIRLERVTGPTRVSADSGSIRLYKEDTSATDIQADSGSVYLHMPASFAGTYDLQADSGSIHAPESKGQTADVVKVRADSGSIRVEQD
jgi:hypothetical protein